MKKLTSLLIVFVLAINLHGQSVDSLVGVYTVTSIWSKFSGDQIPITDTSFYKIKIVKYTDNQIFLIGYYQLDTIKATVISDSIDIFPQTIYYNEYNFYMISGSGRIYTDTIKYQYKSGGPIGLFDFNCVAVKVKENSIYNLIEKKKSLINLFPIDNGFLQLQLKGNFSGEIIIYTPDGKQVLKKPVTGKECTLCTPASGLLLYRFVTEKGEVQSGKVVVW
jgi:hypothetical protein